MSAKTQQHKSPVMLTVLLLGQLILMSMSARHPNGGQTVLSTWIMAAFAPIAEAGEGALSGVSGAVGAVGEMKGAREENVELRRQVDQLTQERDEARQRAAELERLRSQLALPSSPQYQQLAANVVSRDASVWFRHLIIDRGTLDGVKLNMPVVTATGVVGRIIETGPNYARVQIITDKHAGVGAMLQQSGIMGELRGADKSRCELRNVPASDQVPAGEALVTTGLDGIYPKGLMVGTVEQVEDDPNAPWHKITVVPSAPVDRLEHVFVLLVEPPDLKMRETIK